MTEAISYYDKDSSNPPFTEFVIENGNDIRLNDTAIGSGGTSDIYPCKVDVSLLSKVNKMLGTKYSYTSNDVESNNHDEDGYNYAIKLYKVDSNFDDVDLKCFLREVTIMAKAVHPFVIKLIGWNIFENFATSTSKKTLEKKFAPYIVTPRYKCNLNDFIKSGKFFSLSPTKQSKFMYALLRGYYYLHVVLNIIIRDIKTKNIFVDFNDMPIIADFGYSKELSDQKALSNSKVISCGSKEFEPPEKLLNNVGQYGEVTKKTDIFLLGVVLFWMIFNKNEKINQHIRIASAEDIRSYLDQNLYESDSVMNSIGPNSSLGSPSLSKRPSEFSFSPNEDDQSMTPRAARYKNLSSMIKAMLSKDQDERPDINEICREFWMNRKTFTYKGTDNGEFDSFKEQIDIQEKHDIMAIMNSAINNSMQQNNSEKNEVSEIFFKNTNNKYSQIRKLLQLVDKDHYFKNRCNNDSKKKNINNLAALYLTLFYLNGYLVPQDFVLSHHFFSLCDKNLMSNDPLYITMQHIINRIYNFKFSKDSYDNFFNDLQTGNVGIWDTEKLFKKLYMDASICEALFDQETVSKYLDVMMFKNQIFESLNKIDDQNNKYEKVFKEIKALATKYYYLSMGRVGAILAASKSQHGNQKLGEEFLKFASQNSDDIYSKVQYGLCLINQKKYNLALNIFKNLAEEGPGKICYPDAAYTTGELYLTLNDKKMALEYFYKAYKVFGQDEALKYIEALEEKPAPKRLSSSSNDF